MLYLTKDTEIRSVITKLTSAKTLWVDTEVADYNTHNPRLSLIQVLADPKDLTGNRVYLLDVLEKHELVTFFINQIMKNPNLEKVFHNASYDLKFLGKDLANNVTCTWKLAKKIPPHVLAVPNLKLKTLAEKLCQFSDVDKTEQGSDWGRRPLSVKQLQYAKMDPVYLTHVHLRLLELANQGNSNPVSKILDVIVNFFQNDDWKFSQLPGKACLRMGVKAENGEWECLAQAREEQEQFIFCSICPEEVPENKRLSVAEFLMRANWGLQIGKFTMNLENGEVRYETYINVKGDRLSLPLIKNVVYINILTMDRYLPGIVSVTRGSISPEKVIGQIEK